MKSNISLGQLKQTLNNLKNPQFDDVDIYCHPDNLKYLQEIAKSNYPEEQTRGKYNFYNSYGDWNPPLYGIQIFTDSILEKFSKKWVFPDLPKHWSGKYWEYTKEDEVWATPIKHGYWVYDESSPVFYMIKKPLKYNFYDIYINPLYTT